MAVRSFVEGCLACQATAGKLKVPGGVIYEDRFWRVEHSFSPVLLPGFLIVKPLRHCEHIAQLTAEEMATFAPVLHNTVIALTRVMRAEKVYVCSFGESVKHVHFYVIPRMPHMPADGLEVLRVMFEEKKWACSDAEAAQIAAKVREELRQLIK